ncbi:MULTISPECIES: hypothetical protein [Halalkalibacter]|uniref:Uncharacterized protein n=1 Tax=Halalkalibacter alkaliphilus TaxID=2917993 RepID=A0A9X2CT08_9BACI|nr:hypothetical protein [Halalkalibacter alkaliphilus]MCL7747449.1 hypothetical protein [Halalkalibacter alkaliphilus]
MCTINFYIDDNLVRTASGEELEKEMPNWDGKFHKGEKMLFKGEDKLIKNIKVEFSEGTISLFLK